MRDFGKNQRRRWNPLGMVLLWTYREKVSILLNEFNDLGVSDNTVKRNIRVFEMGAGMMGKLLYLRALSRNIVGLRYMLPEDFLSFKR
jgi:hypothetical protein